MKNAKTIALILLAGLLTLGLAACALEQSAVTDGNGANNTTAAPKTAAATTAATTATPAPEQITMKIVSMNTQNSGYDRSGEATIEIKYQKLADAISAKTPDLVLLQECNTAAAADSIRARMTNAADYGMVSGTNATTMILYNKKILSLIDQGCEQIGAANDANGSNYDRYMVWARFRHVESGVPMVVVPVHVDYATKACKAQINIIVNYLKTNFPKIPFILGGDFNLESGTVSATSLTTEGYLDARVSATEKISANEATFPGKNTIIDFVWYKGGMIYAAAANKYEVITDALPTDHRPIYVEITITK